MLLISKTELRSGGEEENDEKSADNKSNNDPDSNFNLQQTCSKPCIATLQTCIKFSMTSLQVHDKLAAS